MLGGLIQAQQYCSMLLKNKNNFFLTAIVTFCFQHLAVTYNSLAVSIYALCHAGYSFAKHIRLWKSELQAEMFNTSFSYSGLTKYSSSTARMNHQHLMMHNNFGVYCSKFEHNT